MSYQHILLVTDLLSDADIVAQRAKRVISGSPEAKLSVLHIVEEDVARFGYELVQASRIADKKEEELWPKARIKLVEFLERNELRATKSELTAAISSSEGIVNYCREENVDLLVIGRHERRGIAAWLVGATADNILPNVSCDSLVVKLDKPVSQ